MENKLHILCVEDEPTLGSLYQNVLEELGHTVETAVSPAQGLQCLDKKRADLVLLDYHFADGRNGLDFLKSIKPMPDPPPVVMVTAGGNENVAIEAARLGAVDYIVKDFRGRFIKLLPMVVERALRHHRLDRQIERLEAELIQAHKRDSLAAMAGGVAHHFNNHLTTIIGCASVTRMELDPSNPAFKSLLKIEIAAQEAAGIASQMLVYSGQKNTEQELLDLTTLIQAIRIDLEIVVPDRIQFRVKVPARPCIAAGNREQIKQALLDPLANAVEAIAGDDNGIINIRLCQEFNPTLQPGEISASRLPSAPCAVLEIMDNGAGIPPENIGHVFDPFFTTKPAARGLGLSNTLGIVRGHGGTITVKSAPGEGTVLRLFFPLSEEHAGKAPETPRNRVEAGHLNILVIDDEEHVLETTKNMLQISGFSVLTALSGEEGVKLFEEHANNIALALVDRAMPNMDGKQVFETLYARNPALPFIMMSGFSAGEALRDFDTLRPTLFLQKPYRPQMLIESVIKALRSRK